MTKFIIILIFEFFSFGSPVTLTIPSQLTEGGTGVLTCDIEAALSVGTWKKGDNTASSIATCTAGGCTETAANARYSYAKTPTTMILTINPLERTSDQGSWTCAHSTNFATQDIGTIYKTASEVTVTVSNRKLTGQTSCVYPDDTSAGQFTWKYNNNNQDTTITGDAITVPTSSTDGCSNSEAKFESILDIDKIVVDSEITVTFKCSFTYKDLTSAPATESLITQSFTISAGCDCFCKVWCIVLVVIVIIYGTSWIVASVVNLVIYNMNQMRLPWHLCDGNLKKWQSWLLLFIFVPYVPSGVAIYLFNTKRPGYCRCVGAPGTDISINFKYTVSSSGEVTVQVKNEAGTILVSVKFIDGKVAGKADINPRVDFTRNVTTGDMSFKLNNIQTSDSGLYTLSGNDVPCSCVELFVTDKPTSGTEMNKFGPIRPLPPINPKKNSDPEKGSPRKLPEPPNPEDGNRLSPLQSNTLSNITETQQANGEQEKTKKKKKKKRKPKNNQVSDEEMEKSS